MALLEVNDVHSGYGEIEILHGIDMAVEEGEMVGIIGPNGAGKSTTYKTIFGLLDTWQGSIYFDGEDVTRYEPLQHLKNGLAYVPQGKSTFSEMTVLENLEMSAYSREDDFGEDLQRIYEFFPVLEEKKSEKAKNLSGGQQQMMEMGGAMLMNPDMLLLDEPSLGLAPKIAKNIFERIQLLNEEEGLTFMIIEQNARRAMEVTDRTYVIEMGENRMDGPSDELLENDEVQQLYLGG